MKEIMVNEKISYIQATDHPLSADIGMVKGEDGVWLYDVGNGEDPLSALTESYQVVLSHFHQDHMGNMGRIQADALYVSKETFGHLPKETKAHGAVHIVTEPIRIGTLHIFPLPSSHAKGCLGLEVDGAYAFIGDALYCKPKHNHRVYNAQLLKQEIEVLERLRSPLLLVSHYKGLVRPKDEVLEELKAIYAMRMQDCPEILITG